MTAPAPVLGDLLLINQHLVVTCCRPTCRREVRLSAARAVDLLGPATPIGEAKRRLRCEACGARGRRKEIDVRPCTLDLSAWQAREAAASAAARGERPRYDLDAYLATLARLAGGDLGGDGPVQWPVKGG
ncbi:hypothetical protein [Phenylobacterium sp.]|uniref:hypothetical protein n=1 Tax=Phenylobacterium sp. TaxID=1871053 RepID=UPI00391BD4BD